MNEFVRIKYSVKIKETGLEIGKEQERPVVVGRGWLDKPMEEFLTNAKGVGEKGSVELPAGKIFGERNNKLIETHAISDFTNHGVEPKPGVMVNADNKIGKVLSVSGGRVKIDFNHPLAGKVLTPVINVEIIGTIEKTEEKIKAMIESAATYDEDKKQMDKMEVVIKKKDVEITAPPLICLNFIARNKIAKDIIAIFDMEKVKFIETYEKTVIDQKKVDELEEQLPVESITEEPN